MYIYIQEMPTIRTGQVERAEQIYKAYLSQDTNTEIISSLMSSLLDQQKYDEMNQYLSSVSDDNSLSYLKGVAAMG